MAVDYKNRNSEAVFWCRLWMAQDFQILQFDVWYPELLSMHLEVLDVEDWVKHSLLDLLVMDDIHSLGELGLDLDTDGAHCWQVLFEGRIRSYWTFTGEGEEFNEELNILQARKAVIPADYFKARFGDGDLLPGHTADDAEPTV